MIARDLARRVRDAASPPALPIPRALTTLPVLRAAVAVGVLAAAWRLGQHPTARTAALLLLPALVVAMFRARRTIVPGLVAVIMLVPLSIGTGGGGVNMAVLGVAGVFGFELVRRLVSRRPLLPASPANAPWLALVLVALLSVLAGGALWDPRVSVDGDFLVVQLAQLAILALSACAFWLPGSWLAERRELAVLAGIVVAVAVYHVLAFVWLAMPYRHAFDVWANPAARVWLVAIPASLALFHDGLRPLPRLALFVLGAAMIALPWRQDAGWASGWLPSLVTLLVLASLRLGRVSLVMGMAAAAPAAALFFGYLLPRIAVEDAWSLATRAQAWRGLVDLLDGRWALGLGLASYWHYWRGIIGRFAFFDPAVGYMHVTTDPKVNMHNNYMDVLGQMGLLGIVVLAWLIAALAWQAARAYRAEPAGFGHAYAAAAIAALTGMLASGMLGDWFFPFVYNVGFIGFRGAALGWLLLGGLCVLDATRMAAAPAPAPDPPPPITTA